MSVKTTLTLSDRMTSTLQKTMKALNSTIRVMEQMNKTVQGLDMRSLQRARKDIENATASLERMKLAGNNTSNGLKQIQNSSFSATSSIQKLIGAFGAFATVYFTLQMVAGALRSFTDASDNFISTNARLSNINDGLQTQLELQNKIYNAAQRGRTAYNDMAGAVAKLNLLARDAFSSNDEAIRFSELMSKAFTVSGSSTQERQAGMYQLTQAMAAGKLQGDEFRSIMENAPMLAQAIADATGKSMGELKEMSAAGTITADVIKKALWNAADDIEAKFKNMPMTFAEAMTVFKNWAQTAFQPIFTRFSQFINSDAFGVLAGHAMLFVNIFVAGIDLAFDAMEAFYNLVAVVGQFFMDNWSWIAPILIVIGVALGSIVAILVVKYAWLGLVRTATLAWAAAQWVVNAAYLASPITWVIIGIIAVIALVVYAITVWGEQSAAVIGFIAGLFAALGAYIFNQVAFWWNMFAAFAEFLINLFIDPTYAVKKLFYDVVTNVIDYMSGMAGSFETAANVLANVFVSGANIAIGAINGLIDAINLIPGVELDKMGKLPSSSVSVISKGLQNFAKNLEAPTSSKNVVSMQRMDMKNIPAAFNAGKEWGYNNTMNASDSLNSLVDKAKSFIGLGDKNAKENPFTDTSALMDSIANMSPTAVGTPAGALDDGKLKGGKLDKIGKIEDKINLANEYLELFRDIAEGQAINNVITLTPEFNVAASKPTVVQENASSAIEKALANMKSLNTSKTPMFPNTSMPLVATQQPQQSLASTQNKTATPSVLNRLLPFIESINGKLQGLLNKNFGSMAIATKEQGTGSVRDKVSIVANRDKVTVPQAVRENTTISNNSNKIVYQTYKSEPVININGDMHSDVDVDDVVKKIEQTLKEEVENSVEGVYK